MNIQAKKIWVLGDVHGDIGALNTLINKRRPDVAIILGDAGFVFAERGFAPDHKLQEVKPHNTKVFWICGNHEHWDFIEQKWGRNGAEPIEICTNLFYCPIGSTLTINGKNILFMGGADSVDKMYRLPTVDWFEQEVLTESDFATTVALVGDKQIDIVCAHTCPMEVPMTGNPLFFRSDDKAGDPTRKILSNILFKYKPKFFFFGHWHKYYNIVYRGDDFETNCICFDTMTTGYGSGRSSADISELF